VNFRPLYLHIIRIFGNQKRLGKGLSAGFRGVDVIIDLLHSLAKHRKIDDFRAYFNRRMRSVKKSHLDRQANEVSQEVSFR